MAARHSSDLQSRTRSGFSRCRSRWAGHSWSARSARKALSRRDVPRPAHPVAHGVQPQRHLAQAQPREEVVCQRDHLDVEVGVGRAERLHAQLVVLAVATVLRVLVPERGRHVPRLPRRHGVVLHVGAGDGGGSLGAQRHQLAVAVLEDVHLLAHDLARLADAAQEHAGVLEDRRDRQPVAGALDQRREAGDRSLPPGRLGPEDVVHALRCLHLVGGRRNDAAGNRRGGLTRIRIRARRRRGRSRAHRRLLMGRGSDFLARELTIRVEHPIEMLQCADQ